MSCPPSGCIAREKGCDPLTVIHDTTLCEQTQEVLVPILMPSLNLAMGLIPLDKLIRYLTDPDIPYARFENLEIVPSGRLHMSFLIKSTDGNHLVLSLPPPADMRLLRSERSSIRSEAAVLQWLSEFAAENGKPGVKVLAHRGRHASIRGRTSRTSLSGQGLAWNLRDYIPRLTKHGVVNAGDHIMYNLSTPSLGMAILALPQPISLEERRSVDFQSGQLLRRASLYSSPNGKFGIAADVLSQIIQQQPDFSRSRGCTPSANTGSSCWSEAFHILLESVLRDAEDFTIAISYRCIRHHFERFRHFLDCVTRPCLVVVNVGEDVNTLVLRREGELKSINYGHGDTNGKQEDNKRSRSIGSHGRIDVTGLREWSHCIFGDPLIASAFGQNSSPDFLHGFHSPLQEAEPGLLDYPSSPVEDQEYAHVRLLLYECYHAVAAIVKEFCRPQDDSYEREMAGRKKLVDVIARLGNLDDEGNHKRKRLNMEMIPAKRPRSEICKFVAAREEEYRTRTLEDP